MTYIASSSGSSDIVGTMLLSARHNLNGGDYSLRASWNQFLTNVTFPNILVVIRTEDWAITDVTDNFDAIAHDSSGNLIVDSTGYIRIANSKKILIQSFYDVTGHSSTDNASCQITTHDLPSTVYSGTNSTGYINSSSLTTYYGPPSVLGGAAARGDKFPSELSNTTTGEYFLKAGIRKLEDEIMYAYMETPSSGNFGLCCRYHSKVGNPGIAYNNTDRHAHFIHITQFS